MEHGFDWVLTSPDTFDDFAVRKQGRECDSRWTERAKTRVLACLYGESQGWYSEPDFHAPPRKVEFALPRDSHQNTLKLCTVQYEYVLAALLLHPYVLYTH